MFAAWAIKSPNDASAIATPPDGVGLGALGLGAPLPVLAAYLLSLAEINEVIDDCPRETASLLADRDLFRALPAEPTASSVPTFAADSNLLALARLPDGSLLFSSQPQRTLAFRAASGASVQLANGVRWHAFTVVQEDRAVQVAHATSVRRDGAVQAASQLLNPLDVQDVPSPLVPLARTLNDPLHRISQAFEAQRKLVADRHGAAIALHGGPAGVGLEVRVVFPAMA